eukprot:473507-Prorocentrum_minimum.AAC.1
MCVATPLGCAIHERPALLVYQMFPYSPTIHPRSPCRMHTARQLVPRPPVMLRLRTQHDATI